MRQRLLILQLIVLVLVAVLDIHFGIGEMYFWRIWWWDILMHMLGGLWVGLVFAYAATYTPYRVSVIHCIIAAFAVGAGWEVFEYVFHMGGSVFMSYPLDTAKDLFDDAVGGALAGLVVRRV